MQFNNPTSTKNENKKYDNSTFKNINRPVALRLGFLLISLACWRPSSCCRLWPRRAAVARTGWRLCRHNTAEGTDALFSLTTGSDNTANGFQALYSNTTGNSNTAIRLSGAL